MIHGFFADRTRISYTLHGRVSSGLDMITGSDSTNLTICVNGEREAITSPVTVARLVEIRGPRPPFAVEVNKRLVRRAEYAVTELHDGDIVEIVTLVGGG